MGYLQLTILIFGSGAYAIILGTVDSNLLARVTCQLSQWKNWRQVCVNKLDVFLEKYLNVLNLY